MGCNPECASTLIRVDVYQRSTTAAQHVEQHATSTCVTMNETFTWLDPCREGEDKPSEAVLVKEAVPVEEVVPREAVPGDKFSTSFYVYK